MAKAEALTLDALKMPQVTPQAATPARSPGAPQTTTSVAQNTPRPKKEAGAVEPTDQVPLQLKIPRDQARAIKIAAAERDMTIRDFMLECFHAYMASYRSQ
jgi:hypothetical protein